MNVLSRPMFNRGGMVHDERTIRNVDDEIYRIAPKTHRGGRQRMDAREEYGRLLREKDYLRGQMNRMANGGGVASMMDPAMMGGPPMDPAMMAPPPMDPAMMAPPPMPMAPEGGIPAPVAGELAAMEQQGMALGADMVMQQEAALDSAENPKQLIDAMRGNELPLQERYNELATFVGPDDAAITPTSVLALTQPAIIMASEGEIDQGIGNLMEGMTGDIMMDDAGGTALPMGMGVGELIAGSPSAPVPMNTGGAVPKLQAGSTPFGTATGPTSEFDLGTQAAATKTELDEIIGMSDQERALQDVGIYGNMFDRFLALASNKDPRSGEDLEGNLFQKTAQAGQGFLTDVAKARAPEIQRETQLSQIALQDALARRTAGEKAQYDMQAAIAASQLGGPTKSQFMSLVSNPAYVKMYAENDPRMSLDMVNLFELGLDQITTRRPITRTNPQTFETYVDYVEDPLPEFLANAVAQRRSLMPQDTPTVEVGQEGVNPTTGLPTTVDGFLKLLNPDDQQPGQTPTLDTESVEVVNPANPEQTTSSSAQDYYNDTLQNVSDKFGLGAFVTGMVDDVSVLMGSETGGQQQRDLLETNLRGLNSQLLVAFLASPGVNVRGQYAWDEFKNRLPIVEGVFTDSTRALGAYKDVKEAMEQEVESELAKQSLPVYQLDPAEMQKSISAIFAMGYELKKLDRLIEALEGQSGLGGANQSDLDRVRQFVKPGE